MAHTSILVMQHSTTWRETHPYLLCVCVYIYCFVEYCTVSMCNSVPVRHLSTCIRFVGDGVLVKFTDKYHTQTHTAVSWSILRK